MKLKYEMKTVSIGGEQMAVPVDSGEAFRGFLRMNGTTADILELLENDTTENEIVEALQKEYDATEEQLRQGVKKVLGILSEKGLLIA